MLGQVDEIVAHLTQEIPAVDIFGPDGEDKAVFRPVSGKRRIADFGNLHRSAADGLRLPVRAVNTAKCLGRHIRRVRHGRAHGELRAFFRLTVARSVAKVCDIAADDKTLLQLKA